MVRQAVLTGIIVLALQGLANAEDVYSIKVKTPGEGEAVTINHTQKLASRTLGTDANGKTLVDVTKKLTEMFVYTETILAKDSDKRPTRLRRRYEKAEIVEDDKTTSLPYQGKTVLIEKKDGKYSFTFDGGKDLTAEEAARLDQEFNQKSGFETDELEALVLPGKPVAVGSPWKIDLEPLAKEITKNGNAEIDGAKGIGTGVLQKVYSKNESQFGALHIKAELPMKTMGKGEKKLILDDGSKFVMGLDFDCCIDGKSFDEIFKFGMKMDVTSVIALPDGSKGKLAITVQTDGDETRRGVPKK
jgi:hypothetical protein